MRFLRFNNFRLDINGYEVLEIDTSQMPELRVDKYDLASSNGIVITNKSFGEKPIKVKGRITTSNENDMNAKLDALKYQLSFINKSLDYEVGGAIRRSTATMTSFKATVSGYACFYEVVFSCNSLASLIDSTALSLTTPATTSPTYHTISNTGGYNAPLNLDVSLTSYDGLEQNDSLMLENITNGQRMRITREWVWADRIVIDGDNKQVLCYPATQLLFDNFDSSSAVTVVTASTTKAIYSGWAVEGDGMLAINHTGSSSTLEFYTTGADRVGTSINLTNYSYLLFAIAGASALANITNIQIRVGSGPLTTNYSYKNITTQYDGSAFSSSTIAYIKVDLSSLSTAGTGGPIYAVDEIRFVITGAGSFNSKTLYVDKIFASKAGTTPSVIDYEGSFITLDVGSNQLKISDNFTKRQLAINNANYKKRYL